MSGTLPDTLPPPAPAEPGLRAPSRQPLSHAESEFVRELFELHRLSLYRYLKGLLHSREDASEVLQESYLRLLRQPSFDRLRENARAYLFQTATNLARDLFRTRAAKGIEAERDIFSASGLDTPHWASWPELALQGEQIESLIVRALSDMDPRVRSALLLYRFRHCKHSEIAVQLGVCERTVERYIRTGLSLITERLEAGL